MSVVSCTGSSDSYERSDGADLAVSASEQVFRTLDHPEYSWP